MPSLIEGYNYDIFISYRQKDNKYDGWVTEFVENLNKELEATFKEDISVYFDINPHDGLLETHDVDESLKDKLKCLIFVPIISRTYCDPKAFAWEHEFKAFVKQTSEDQYGLKVKLANGNVESRVLPIQIHDLDPNDTALCESILNGALRSIEFIYKESGVDKPLAPDDDEKKNLNNTKYRIQIVKVAHAIKDIITAIMQHEHKPEELSQKVTKQTKEIRKSNKAQIITGSVLGLALIILGILFIPKLLRSGEIPEKSIAILPFIDDSPDADNSHIINGLMDDMLINLQKISDLRVISRNSVEQFRGYNKPSTPVIAEKLGVNYIVEGSGQKYGNNLRLRVQLITVSKGKEKHIWGEVYEKVITRPEDYFDIQSDVAQSIAAEVKAIISPEEKQYIESIPTTNLSAYDFYMRGKEYRKRSYREEDLRYALQLYEKAVEIDPEFTLAWVGMADCTRMLYWFAYDLSKENLASTKGYIDKAIALSPGFKEVRFEEARYYYHCSRDYKRALEIMEKLSNEYPNDDEIIAWTGHVYRRMGEFRKSLELSEKALSLNPSDWSYWADAAHTLEALCEYKKAEDYYNRTIDLNPSNTDYYLNLSILYISTGQLQKAREFLTNNEESMNPERIKRFQSWLEYLSRNYALAIQIANTLSDDPINNTYHYYTKHLDLGLLYWAISDNEMANKHFEAERDLILDKIKEYENDQRLYRTLGIVLAGLGIKDQAIEAGKKALEILNYDIDKLQGYLPEVDMVKILMMIGEYDDAMTQLEIAISHYAYLTVEELKIDPFWDPVRNHEKFQEIINNPAYQVNL